MHSSIIIATSGLTPPMVTGVVLPCSSKLRVITSSGTIAFKIIRLAYMSCPDTSKAISAVSSSYKILSMDFRIMSSFPFKKSGTLYYPERRANSSKIKTMDPKCHRQTQHQEHEMPSPLHCQWQMEQVKGLEWKKAIVHKR